MADLECIANNAACIYFKQGGKGRQKGEERGIGHKKGEGVRMDRGYWYLSTDGLVKLCF